MELIFMSFPAPGFRGAGSPARKWAGV